MPWYRWPRSAERVDGCPRDTRRRPRHKPPTERRPSVGGTFASSLPQHTPGDRTIPAYGPLALTERRTLTGKFLGRPSPGALTLVVQSDSSAPVVFRSAHAAA